MFCFVFWWLPCDVFLCGVCCFCMFSGSCLLDRDLLSRLWMIFDDYVWGEMHWESDSKICLGLALRGMCPGPSKAEHCEWHFLDKISTLFAAWCIMVPYVFVNPCRHWLAGFGGTTDSWSVWCVKLVFRWKVWWHVVTHGNLKTVCTQIAGFDSPLHSDALYPKMVQRSNVTRNSPLQPEDFRSEYMNWGWGLATVIWIAFLMLGVPWKSKMLPGLGLTGWEKCHTVAFYHSTVYIKVDVSSFVNRLVLVSKGHDSRLVYQKALRNWSCLVSGGAIESPIIVSQSFRRCDIRRISPSLPYPTERARLLRSCCQGHEYHHW